MARNFTPRPAEAVSSAVVVWAGERAARNGGGQRVKGNASNVRADGAGAAQVRERRLRAGSNGREPETPLAEAQRWALLGRMVAGVVHDFRNVLAGVSVYGDLLQNALPAKASARRYGEELRNVVARGEDLTTQLLALAAPERAKAKATSLRRRVAESKSMIQRLVGSNVELTLRQRAPHWMVSLSPAQIHQIVVNLAVNARDAMPKGGRLTIETGGSILRAADAKSTECAGGRLHVGEYATLVVRDTGTGMDEATRAHACEPFFTTKAYGGTGLGLATVQGIVTQAKSALAIASEPGGGTCVTVWLPRVRRARRNRE